MGRSPCCEADANVKKGPWTTEEDKKLMDYIEEHGAGNWRHLPKRAGLNRCGKSCRLRWTNYLRPDIKRGTFTEEEERLIIHLHSLLGNKWSAIANELPGRTDNEIKNYWNTHIRKKLLMMGIDPVTHMPRTDLNLLANLPSLIAAAAGLNSNLATNPLMNALQLPNLLQTMIQSAANGSHPNMTGMVNNTLLGSSFGLQDLHNPNQTPPLSFPNSGIQYHPNDFNMHAQVGNDLDGGMNYGSCNMSEFGIGSRGCDSISTTTTTATTSSMSHPTANSMPSFASASPENNTVDQAPELVNPGDVSSGSPARSTPFEPWSWPALDDLESDLGWKDILDQISWSNPLEEEMGKLRK